MINADSLLTVDSQLTADGRASLTPYAPSITIDNVIDALAAFIAPFVGAAEIVRAQANRTPMPRGECVVLTELLQVDIETPTVTGDPDNAQVSLTNPVRLDVQIDFYGSNSGDQCRAVKAVYRSGYAADAFPWGIDPLYCNDGVQSPLITGEQQYQGRWTLTASLQYNAAITLPQQSANQLIANLINVDVTYPPN